MYTYVIYIIYISKYITYIMYILYRYNCLNEKNEQRSKHKKVNLTLCIQTILDVCKTCSNIVLQLPGFTNEL